MASFQLFGDGFKRSSVGNARAYNLLAARLIAELVRNSLGPRGKEKLLVDIMGEVTITKDGATLLRKIDVEHPAAKVMIEASNAVDNEVGDGTTSVVVFAGALVQKAEELLTMGISPSVIVDGYIAALDIVLKALQEISHKCRASDRLVMNKLVRTCLSSKALARAGDKAEDLIVEAVCTVGDFSSNTVETDDIKIEEKLGGAVDLQLVRGIVIDKTIDSSSMPKSVESARILVIDEDLEGKRTKTDAEIRINSPDHLRLYSDEEASILRSKVRHIIDSGANVVISRKGINTYAQNLLMNSGIISVRRVKENDLNWVARATGAEIAGRLDHEHRDNHGHGQGHHRHDHEIAEDKSDCYHHADINIKLGHADRVCERLVGEDRIVFIEGCKNPKAVTLLLRAGSKRTLDECHRGVLDAVNVLRDFVRHPSIVAGGGSTEAAIARKVRQSAMAFEGREQIVIEKFADALEEIPLAIAKNAGMNPIDTLTQLRSSQPWSGKGTSSRGIDAVERKVRVMFPEVIEPTIVKEQVFKTAVEVVSLLVRVDDVLMAKPMMHSHTHDDGTTHSHPGGGKEHRHDHFDRLGKKQRPAHHYY